MGRCDGIHRVNCSGTMRYVAGFSSAVDSLRRDRMSIASYNYNFTYSYLIFFCGYVAYASSKIEPQLK